MPDPRTITNPSAQEAGWAIPQPVMGLRIAGTDTELSLLDRKSYVLGSSKECDIVLDSPHVSGRHCELVRQGIGFEMRDLSSKNGTYVDGKRLPNAYIAEGDIVVLGTTALFAYSERTQRLRRRARVFIGFDTRSQMVVDETMRLAIRDDANVILISPKGGEPDVLARLIHDNSRRGHGPFVKLDATPLTTPKKQLACVARASHGSIYIGASQQLSERKELVDALMHRDYPVRMFAGSASRDAACEQLGPGVYACRFIDLRPLSARIDEIGEIVNGICYEAIGTTMRINKRDLASFRRCAKDTSLAAMRKLVVALAWVSLHGSLRKAAAETGVPRGTIQARISRHGMAVKPLRLNKSE